MDHTAEPKAKRAKTERLPCCKVFAVCRSKITMVTQNVADDLGIKGSTLRGWCAATEDVYKKMQADADKVVEKYSLRMEEGVSDAEKLNILEDSYLDYFSEDVTTGEPCETPTDPTLLKLWAISKINSGYLLEEVSSSLGFTVEEFSAWKSMEDYEFYLSYAEKIKQRSMVLRKALYCPLHRDIDLLYDAFSEYTSQQSDSPFVLPVNPVVKLPYARTWTVFQLYCDVEKAKVCEVIGLDPTMLDKWLMKRGYHVCRKDSEIMLGEYKQLLQTDQTNSIELLQRVFYSYLTKKGLQDLVQEYTTSLAAYHSKLKNEQNLQKQKLQGEENNLRIVSNRSRGISQILKDEVSFEEQEESNNSQDGNDIFEITESDKDDSVPIRSGATSGK